MLTTTSIPVCRHLGPPRGYGARKYAYVHAHSHTRAHHDVHHAHHSCHQTRGSRMPPADSRSCTHVCQGPCRPPTHAVPPVPSPLLPDAGGDCSDIYTELVGCLIEWTPHLPLLGAPRVLDTTGTTDGGGAHAEVCTSLASSLCAIGSLVLEILAEPLAESFDAAASIGSPAAEMLHAMSSAPGTSTMPWASLLAGPPTWPTCVRILGCVVDLQVRHVLASKPHATDRMALHSALLLLCPPPSSSSFVLLLHLQWPQSHTDRVEIAAWQLAASSHVLAAPANTT